MELVEVQTQRLRIIALTPELFRIYIGDRKRCLEMLGLAAAIEYCEPEVQAEFDEACRARLEEIKSLPGGYLWRTNWLISHQDREAGAFFFKHQPDAQGHAEIGYAILPNFRGKGFAAEAVAAMAGWAFEDARTTAIIAEAPQKNAASRRVLEKCGFRPYMQSPDSVFFKLSRPVSYDTAC